jgi:putative acetyltransferase
MTFTSQRDFTILPATSSDIADAKRLFVEYQTEFGFTPCFQNFQYEIDTLPGKYAEPAGCLLIARDSQGNASGTAALRPLDFADTCEMKRLYVTPAARGTGLGQRLMNAIFASARERGYKRMRLDTIRGKMDRAIAMYRAAGFHEIPPWYESEMKEIAFFEKEL